MKELLILTATIYPLLFIVFIRFLYKSKKSIHYLKHDTFNDCLSNVQSIDKSMIVLLDKYNKLLDERKS